MSAQIGLGVTINSVAEFNRRAGLALKALDLREDSGDGAFCKRLAPLLARDDALTEQQQLNLYRVVARHHRRIWDKQITIFAQLRTREAA